MVLDAAKQLFRDIRGFRRALVGQAAKAYLRMHGAKLDKGLRIYSLPICRRHPLAVIQIGSNVTILNKLSENLAGISHRSVLVASDPEARLVIGNNVGMSGVILYCRKQIVIEDNVNLGAGVRIYDTDFHPVGAAARRRHDVNEIKSADVRVCEDAWIGAEALILKGVTVGRRAVVGARAVVTRNVPDDCVVAGPSAQVVRLVRDEE